MIALAPYASHPESSRGRIHPESGDPARNAFQRDRDRIVHSTAFRRLVYKTQVFLNHEGDLFRTRMTHSLEVAQLGRSIGRLLGLHEDLIEAISLAHDLGHTPFGHAGQRALNQCMRATGGFEHNLQSLRVVDQLEQRYPDFDGLNLCFETREGILKHCSAADARKIEQQEPGGVAQRFLNHTQPSLEAQLCNLADSIAYNAHDIDDGVRSGLLGFDQILEGSLFAPYLHSALALYPQLRERQRLWLYQAIRFMLGAQVQDVATTTAQAIATAHIADAAQARQVASLVRFSEPMQRQSEELHRFLMQHLYRHPQVVQQTQLAEQTIQALFQAYLDQPENMPAEFHQRPDQHRAIADYIAGMTDRFAQNEHHRLTGLRLWPSAF